jgi:hypothetical protein
VIDQGHDDSMTTAGTRTGSWQHLFPAVNYETKIMRPTWDKTVGIASDGHARRKTENAARQHLGYGKSWLMAAIEKTLLMSAASPECPNHPVPGNTEGYKCPWR